MWQPGQVTLEQMGECTLRWSMSRRLHWLLVAGAGVWLAWSGFQSLQARVTAPAPRLASSLTVSMGAVSGAQADGIQRLSYQATLSNNGAAPLRDWHWEVVVAPEILQRSRSASHTLAPEWGTIGYTPDLEAGRGQEFKGEILFAAEGLTKADLAALEPLVQIRITAAGGRELLVIGARGRPETSPPLKALKG